MSVQTQIDRISGAVSAALDALTEKGVTVPAGTKVDGLAALIAAIEAGGGSGGRMTSGFFTTSDDITSDIVITHGLGVKPYFVCVIAANNDGGSYTKSPAETLGIITAIQYKGTGGRQEYGVRFNSPASSVLGYNSGRADISDTGKTGAFYRIGISENDFTLKQQSIHSSKGLGVGYTYYWLAIAEEVLQ